VIHVREIVVPGEAVADRPVRMHNTYIDGGKTYAATVGLFDREHNEIIPLEGGWVPHIEDVVVGIVKTSKNSVYEIDLSYFKRSILIASKFERHPLKVGEAIEASIKDIEDRKTIILYRERVLNGGTMMEVKASKVPRIIGKNSTMVNQISELTGASITVGRNGIVWLRGGNVELAAEAILKIENEAHIKGLTERIRMMLEDRTRKGE
jgi:exosome complex component RRP4